MIQKILNWLGFKSSCKTNNSKPKLNPYQVQLEKDEKNKEIQQEIWDKGFQKRLENQAEAWFLEWKNAYENYLINRVPYFIPPMQITDPNITGSIIMQYSKKRSKWNYDNIEEYKQNHFKRLKDDYLWSNTFNC